MLQYQAVMLALLLVCDFPVHYFETPLLRALSDNIGHALISMTLWLACSAPFNNNHSPYALKLDPLLIWIRCHVNTCCGTSLPIWIFEALLAMSAASFLDIDHFIEAGSSTLFGATHLTQRPRGHSVFFILLVVVRPYLLITLSILSYNTSVMIAGCLGAY